MLPIAIHIARIASALIGLTFLYMALFMYQDESGRLQNRLVNLWTQVNLKHEAFLNKRAAVVKASAGLAEIGLKWLLGDKLISIQMVVVSFCMSVASVGFVRWLATFSSHLSEPVDRYQVTLLLIIGVTHFLYGLFAARILFRKQHWVIALVLLLVLTSLSALFFGFMNLAFEFPFSDVISFGFLALLFGLAGGGFGVVCDLILFTANRFVIRSMTQTNAERVLIAGLCFTLFWLFLLIESTRLEIVGDSGLATTHDPFLRLLSHHSMAIGIATWFGMSTSLFNLIASGSVLFVLLALLFNRVFWPSASRVIYALYQWQVLANRGLQLSGAIAFLSFAFPWVGTVIKVFKGG